MPLIATRGVASAQGFGEFGAVAGPANYIEDVFSTYLYTGNGSTQTITNGIDLAGKGGLVWIKSRTASISHVLMDTNRGVSRYLNSNTTGSEQLATGFGVTNFGSTGFTVVDDSSGNYGVNGSGGTYGGNYASWTFRKQAKFFDVVTYTGDGVQNRAIAHNLGSVPGCIIIKRLDSAINWQVYHRSLEFPGYLILNAVDSIAFDQNRFWATPTATNFILGSGGVVNANGGTYVAYLFAHDAGGFGLTGTDNVISCGSFTTDGSGNATVSLGYEPQWVLYKCTSRSGDNWIVVDDMRSFTTSRNSTVPLFPNTSGAELASTFIQKNTPSSNGFSISQEGTSQTFIYIAIRRGPMKVPTSGTSVFAPVVYAGNGTSQTITTGFANDMEIIRRRGSAENNVIEDKLRGSRVLFTNTTDSELTSTGDVTGYTNTGFNLGASNQGSTNDGGGPSYISWNFRRAPGFFDEVCYTGDSTLGRAVPHNLGAVPELMIVKNRNNTENWVVYSATTGATKRLILNSTAAAGVRAIWADTTPTSTNFYVGGSGVLGETNYTTYTYVAYLFASVAGVSKVGSYTGTGTTQQINCGFTGGARFVLIKRTDSTGDWYVWDSARGIVAGNDPYLLLNSTAAEVTSTDYIDTYSAGFEISSTAPAAINANSGTFIFLAIA